MGDINYRVSVLEYYRVLFKAALRKLQREMRCEAPGNAKVVEDLEAAK